jgi:hypothetical protein
MAVTAFLYGNVFSKAFNKEIDLDTDTIKCALTTSTYAVNQDTHSYFSSVTNEVSGTGYTAGGVTLGSPVPSYTGATNVFAFAAANASWTTATFTARYAVVYDSTGTSTTSALIMYVDFGADQTVSAGTFTVQWNAGGLFSVTVS